MPRDVEELTEQETQFCLLNTFWAWKPPGHRSEDMALETKQKKVWKPSGLEGRMNEVARCAVERL